MTLKDVRDAYEGLSAKASDIVRQLSLAGIGIAWLFRNSSSGTDSLDPKLIQGSFLIAVALTLDLLQYLISTPIWFLYFRSKEKHGAKLDTEFEAPAWFNWPNIFFFCSKSVVLVLAYVHYIGPYLWGKFVH